jgi:hypothetical protein
MQVRTHPGRGGREFVPAAATARPQRPHRPRPSEPRAQASGPAGARIPSRTHAPGNPFPSRHEPPRSAAAITPPDSHPPADPIPTRAQYNVPVRTHRPVHAHRAAGSTTTLVLEEAVPTTQGAELTLGDGQGTAKAGEPEAATTPTALPGLRNRRLFRTARCLSLIEKFQMCCHPRNDSDHP